MLKLALCLLCLCLLLCGCTKAKDGSQTSTTDESAGDQAVFGFHSEDSSAYGAESTQTAAENGAGNPTAQGYGGTAASASTERTSESTLPSQPDSTVRRVEIPTESTTATQPSTEAAQPTETKAPSATQAPSETVSATAANLDSDFLKGVEDEILRLVNRGRQLRGANALQSDAALKSIAREKSAHMAKYNYFAHEAPNGDLFFDTLERRGIDYETAGENIAYVSLSLIESKSQEQIASTLYNNWLNSSGHKKNMMNSSFTLTGIGVCIDRDAGRILATQLFINP